MTSPLVLARVLVVLTLALSGVLKLREPQAARDGFVSLRLPRRLVDSPAPTLLPFGELVLALAVLLAPGWSGVVAAALAVLVFVGYTVLIGRALRFEEPVRCGCFGKLGLAAVSGLTLVRNVLLVVVAALALQQAMSGDSLLAQLRGMTAHDWGWLAGALAAAVLAGLVAHGSGAEEEHLEPPVDEEGDYLRQPIPFGQLRLPDGALVSLQAMAQHSAVLLVFLNAHCGSCLRVLEVLPHFDRDNPEVSTGAVFHEANPPEGEVGVPVLRDPDGAVARMFRVGPPGAVLLGADGLLAGGPVIGEHEVLQFLHDIAGQLAEARPEQTSVEAGRP